MQNVLSKARGTVSELCVCQLLLLVPPRHDWAAHFSMPWLFIETCVCVCVCVCVCRDTWWERVGPSLRPLKTDFETRPCMKVFYLEGGPWRLEGGHEQMSQEGRENGQ